MTDRDDLLTRADDFYERGTSITTAIALVGELAAAVRSERAARQKAEALWQHATARADETQARLGDLRDAVCEALDDCTDPYATGAVRGLLAVVPAADDQ